ncbi:hypothetical protein H2203_007027 [Taxawa tesnikishii (nom. ined.)]|nr:hypothetical protein H2203_007027 [Dothideales sp. JES 119]
MADEHDNSAPYTDEPDKSAVKVDVDQETGLDDQVEYAEEEDGTDEDQKPTWARLWPSIRIVCISLGLCILFVAGFLASLRSRRHRRPDYATSKLYADSKPAPAKAINWRLNFPQLYPQLGEPSPECQAAWASLTSVPCHEKIFNRGWDNGTHLSLFEPEPMRYCPQLCDETCRTALSEAYTLIRDACSGTHFQTDGYSGTFNTTWLEPGPVEALGVLLRRNTHTCRKSEAGDSEYEYCMIELYERWYILDGMNAGNLEGITRFVQDTDRPGREMGGWRSGTRGSGTDGGWKQSYKIKVPERTFGPGRGETTCGWCTLAWFENKLNAWREGAVISPDSGKPVSLPEFIHRIRDAGQRCETAQWNAIYEKAIMKYQEMGLLEANWETGQSGDLEYLITHGAGPGDEPIPSIDTAIAKLDASLDSHPTREASRAKACLEELSTHIQSLPCYIHLDNSTIESMIAPVTLRTRNNLFSSYCSEECSSALGKTHGSSPAFKYCKTSAAFHPLVKPYWKTYRAAHKIRQNVCHRVDRSTKTEDQQCASVFHNNDPEWVWEGRPSTPEFIEAVSQQLAALEATPVPDVVTAALGKSYHDPESQALRKALPKWEEELKNGICSACVWQWIVGEGTTPTPLSYLQDAVDANAYVDFAERMFKTCAARGANWLGGLPYGGDDAVWRIQEANGKVYRYFEEDANSWSWTRGRWHMGDENPDTANGGHSIARGKWGSLWHLRVALREFKARGEGRWGSGRWKRPSIGRRRMRRFGAWTA